jgi:hypothetical protein
MLFSLSYAILWGVALLQLVAVFVLVHRLEILRLQTERSPGARDAELGSLPEGSLAPIFSAVTLDTSRPVLSSELYADPTLLLFLSADCLDCRKVVLGLDAVEWDALEGLVIYCIGGRSRCDQYLGAVGRSVPVLVGGETDVPAMYKIRGVPMGVGIDCEGRIAGSVSPSSAKEVAEYLARLRTRAGRVEDADRTVVANDMFRQTDAAL